MTGRTNHGDRSRSLLHVDSLTRSFGGLMAVNRVSFDIAVEEVVGLVGPNGAGKTTAFNLISGFLAPDSGQILLNGESIAGRPPHEIAAKGISRTFQGLQIFGNMSVLENILVGRHLHTHTGLLAAALGLPHVRLEERRARGDAMRRLESMGLAARAGELARNLSFGEQRRLEICRAVSTEPVLLLLDEPSAGLTQQEKVVLADLIRQIRRDGVAVLIVEHDVDLVMELADRVVVLDYGQLIAQGTPDKVQSDPLVIEAYLGTGWGE